MPELFGDGAYKVFKEIDRVLILACGTSYYRGLTAKYWLESMAKIPTRSKWPASTATAKRAPSAHAGRDHLPNRRNRRHLAALKHARAWA